MSVLSGIEPAGVFRFFEEISNIPRGSYNEKAVSDYCVRFAQKRKLEYYQDKLYNVIIIKEASAGREDEEPFIIQGHLDMVCEKTNDSEHDFLKDGIKLETDGEYIYGRNTTLGGDDGIAIAFGLAILDDDTISHPRLEVVFTVSEEVGMDGATYIDLSMLKGKKMLNLDSEDEGVLLAGCAGGNTTEVSLPLCFTELPVKGGKYEINGELCEVKIKGLLGGHSGTEIDKNRANADCLLGRFIAQLYKKDIPFDLIDIYGGNKENAIPRESYAKIAAYDYEKVLREKEEFENTMKMEYGVSDSGITFEIKKLEGQEASVKLVSEESLKKIITLINCIPNGIQKMSSDIEGLVETSLNLGIMRLEEGNFKLVYSVRSQIEASKKYLTEKIRLIAETVGASVSVSGEYPAWEYRPESPLRKKMTSIYEDMYGEKPVVAVIHAGLECGILAGKITDLDCVSFGPDIYDIHTTEERMSLESVKRVWEYTLKILESK